MMSRLVRLLAAFFSVAILAVLGISYFGFLQFRELFPIVSVKENPTKFVEFFRMRASFTHEEDEPVEIDLVIGCRVQYRQVLGEGVSGRAIRVPYYYGVPTKDGRAVIVQTPGVCGYDPEKVVPDDFLPVVLYAPRPNDLEFLIAYTSERAYEQPVSKLKFHKATITRATEEEFNAWKQTGVPNVIPHHKTKYETANYFTDSFFPEDDIRAKLSMGCYGVVRLPIPDHLKERVRALWPANRPRYWVAKPDDPMAWYKEVIVPARSASTWIEPPPEGVKRSSRFSVSTKSDSGIWRAGGGGELLISPTLRSGSGAIDRIPIRTNTGLPWLERAATPDEVEYHFDMADGLDRGFLYCYRGKKPSWDNLEDTTARPRKYFIDGNKVGEIDLVGVGLGWGHNTSLLMERDDYFFSVTGLGLSSEFTRQE